jgi:nucleoid DNA-binding protein
MTKPELILEISKGANLTKKAAEATLDSFLKSIKNSLKKGNEVRLIGFGTFKVSKRAARMGRNPRTGAAIKIAALKVPTFKAGQDLKAAVK